MRRFAILVLLLCIGVVLYNNANAGQAIYQQLHQSPSMEDRCMERIGYYEDLIERFEPGGPDENWVKWQWCKEQLEDWERYCFDEYIE